MEKVRFGIGMLGMSLVIWLGGCSSGQIPERWSDQGLGGSGPIQYGGQVTGETYSVGGGDLVMDPDGLLEVEASYAALGVAPWYAVRRDGALNVQPSIRADDGEVMIRTYDVQRSHRGHIHDSFYQIRRSVRYR